MSVNPPPYPVDDKIGFPCDGGGYQPVPTAPPPGVYYAPGPSFVQQQQPIPMQQFTVVTQQQPPAQSFVGHIILSCFVSWCCCCPLGLTAFIFALVAQSSATSSFSEGQRMGRCSLGFSIAGVVIGVIACIVLMVFVGFVHTVEASEYTICHFRIDGTCYMERDYINLGKSCLGVGRLRQENYCYHNGTMTL